MAVARSASVLLLATTALSSALALPQTAAAQQAVPASAQPAGAKSATEKHLRTTAEDVVVQGTRHRTAGAGLMKRQTDDKEVSTVSQAFIATQAPIQNAYQYVALTPGVITQTADPFGLSTQSSINIHGLGQDELGYTLEGMPLNDIGYYTAYPSQFIDSENIDEVSLAQGSADLDSPVISEAGGLMKVTMLDPSLHPGGSIDASYGSYNTNREFIRLDSGLIGHSGIRAFVSYSHTGSDQWRGDGRVKRQHIDFKFVKEWGEGNRVAWSGEWHDGITPSYVRPTLDSYRTYGANAPENNLASTFTSGSYNYWKDYVGTFRIVYTSIPSAFTLADNLVLNVTPYFQYGYGNGPYEDVLYDQTAVSQGGAGPFQTSIPNNAATGGSVMANFEDLQYRSGLVTKLTWTRGHNSFIVGDWYDYSNESDVQSYSGLSPSGAPADIWGDNAAEKLRILSGPYAGQPLLSNADDVITQTNELFIADVLKLMNDRLTIEAGLKYAMVQRHGVNEVPGPQYDADIYTDEPLPRLGVRYNIDHSNMIFASVSTDFRTASEQTFFNQYYQGTLDYYANTDLKPEFSISETLGYRYQGPTVMGSVSLFNYNFTNRQISTIGGDTGQEQLSINAGGQTTRGVDLEMGTRPWHHISPYASMEYLHATIDNNIQDGVDYARTAGKTAIRSPNFQAAIGLNYDDGDFFGQFDVKYVGKQYTTFTDDESIPAYVTPDLSFGYRLPKIGLPSRTVLQLNLINIGSDYLSGVAAPTINARTTTGVYGTTIGGSAPTYYLAAGLAVLFTAKQAF